MDVTAEGYEAPKHGIFAKSGSPKGVPYTVRLSGRVLNRVTGGREEKPDVVSAIVAQEDGNCNTV